MKLAGAEASRYLAKPDPAKAGLLIHGADPMRVALKRAESVLALIGNQGEAEMRLSRMSGADLRKDGTLLLDAIKSVGFFPGPRLASATSPPGRCRPQRPRPGPAGRTRHGRCGARSDGWRPRCCRRWP